MKFEYLIAKIKSAEFSTEPFKHIYIDDFFTTEHFQAVTQSQEINLSPAANDSDLFKNLFAAGYKVIDFPGCVVDRSQYIKWHRERQVDHSTNTACEGYGMTLRLTAPQSPIISELHEFLVGETFRDAMADKFGVDLTTVFPDSGIQKYLDGYEISPHPDIRKKALTYMVNINPHAGAEELDHHTHYMKFREPYRYVQAFWEGNEKQDRCWVPWNWCETVKQQTRNNSIVIFSPDNSTLHGVKATYNHLAGQRTQLYGNLWYNEVEIDGTPTWEDLSIARRPDILSTGVDKLKNLLRTGAKDLINPVRADSNVIKDRLKTPGY